MSSAEHFVRHHKRQTDLAITEAFARLATNALAHATFTELLHGIRSRGARLLSAPIVDGHHAGVEGLVNLSRFAGAHIRTIAEWQGCDASWRRVIASLAQHLVGQYAIPPFLAASWYAVDGAFGEKKREWFIAHAAGARFRSLSLPIRMTRQMEHLFRASHDHFGVEYAMRRAELVGLGASEQLVQAVLATRFATDLRNGDFWRTVWLLLIANARAIDCAQVGPLLDFVQAIRHERVAAITARRDRTACDYRGAGHEAARRRPGARLPQSTGVRKTAAPCSGLGGSGEPAPHDLANRLMRRWASNTRAKLHRP